MQKGIVNRMSVNESVIVGLGEILWDVFPDGPRFGGAPANFACHVAGLGARAEMVSAVGTGSFGDQAVAILRERNVGTSGVQRHESRPTGTVNVSLDDAGHASYEFAADTAWDSIRWSDDLARLAGEAGAVCFGTLGQRSDTSRETIQRFVSATPADALRTFDINLRPPFVTDSVVLRSLELANVVKLNEDELRVLASLCGLSGSDQEMLRTLARKFDLQAAALTRGREGAMLLRGDEISVSSGLDIQVVDTVGAGDSFTAAFVVGLIRGDDLDAINDRASRVAAFVCSQNGATPPLPGDLANG